MAAKADAPGSLRSRAVAGFAWGMGTNVLVQLSRIAFAIALARLLTPHEYGLASMALVFSALVLAFSDLSLGVGLVQRPTISEADRSTVFWTASVVGVALTATGIALSEPLASFYGERTVQPLFAALSVTFAITSLGSTHAALLHREMRYRAINVRTATSTVVGGLIGLGFAAAGYGAWALIAGQIAVASLSTALLWLSLPWRPRLVYSLESLRNLGGFGIRIFGVRLLEYARTNGDKLLVGRILGSSALGVYTIAFNIQMLPISRFVVVAQDTLLPALSRLQDQRERLAAAWLKASRLIAAILVPVLTGLAVVAPDLVSVLLGDRWAGAAPLLQIMAVGTVILAVTAIAFQVLTALDRSSTLLRFSVAEVALLIAAVAIGIRWGLTGLVLAYALVQLHTRAYLAWLTARVVGIPFRRYIRGFAGVAEAALPMLAAIVAARYALLQTGAPDGMRLVAVVATGAAVYAPLCLWRVPELRAELGRLRRRIRRAPKATALAR